MMLYGLPIKLPTDEGYLSNALTITIKATDPYDYSASF